MDPKIKFSNMDTLPSSPPNYHITKIYKAQEGDDVC